MLKGVNAIHAGGMKQQAGGRAGVEDLRASGSAPGQVQLRAVRYAQQSVGVRRPDGVTGVQAISELLKLSAESYSKGKGLQKTSVHADFVADRIDEVVSLKTVPMLDALPDLEASFYAEESNVVDWSGKSETLKEELEQHYGFLGGSRDEWVKYLLRPDLPPGLWTFKRRADIKAINGVSAVYKKNPEKLRKLIMAVPANYIWCDVRGRADHGLGGGGALSLLRVLHGSLDVARCDESNAFSSIVTPPWMWPWMATPAVPAILVRDILPPELLEVPDTELIFPCYTRLPMGSSHSVHIMMAINVESVGRALVGSRRLEVKEIVTQELDLPDEGEVLDTEWVDVQRDRRTSEKLEAGMTVRQFADHVQWLKRSVARVMVVLHVFAGARRKNDVHDYVERFADESGVPVFMFGIDLAFDVRWDFSDPHTVATLMELAHLGLIDVVLGGPPCSTWSRARFRHIPGRGGPRPLRFRDQLLGRQDLSGWEAERVTEANVLLFNFLGLCEAVRAQSGSFLIEHPADPGEPPYPSIWILEATQGLAARAGTEVIVIDQCMYGGAAQKPTGLLSNLLGISDGILRCDGRHTHSQSAGLDSDGKFATRRLQAYPSGLCRYIGWSIVRTLVRMREHGCGPGGWARGPSSGPRISHWSVSDGGPLGGCFLLLNEKYGRGGRFCLCPEDVGCYVHVDDGVVMTVGEECQGSAPKCNGLMHRVADAWEETGFLVPERVEAADDMKVVGYRVTRSPPALHLDVDKAWKLVESLRWLLRVAWVDVELLRAVTGTWLWGALLRRELLSVPHALFKFMDKHEGQVTTWWPSVRREVKVMMQLVPTMSCDLSKPSAPLVFSSDAEGVNAEDFGGYGIVGAKASPEETEEVIAAGTRPGHTVARLDGTVGHLNRSDKEIANRIPVSRVPRSLLEKPVKEWTELGSGRWQRADHITLGEGRAAIKLLRALASRPGAQGHVIANLEDNEGLSAAMAKGRSPAVGLNSLLRQRAALCVASDITFCLPWVDTKHQAADCASRRR